MNIADLFATLRISPNKQSFDAADKLIGGLKTALGALAAVAGARALNGFIQDTVALGGKINDLSQVAGISTDTLQVMGHVAGQNSSDMDAMAGALGKLQNNMRAAADGGEAQQKAFAKLGVSIRDVNGELRPTEDVFEDIAINQRSMTNEVDRGTAVFDTLGKSGRALLPTMNEIADRGMAEITKEAHELGAVIQEDAIAALDEFGDTQDKVKTALIGLRNQAVVALLPTLQKLADKFLLWVRTNRELIQQKLQTVLGLLIKGLTLAAKAVDILVIALQFLDKHADIVKVALLGLGAALTVFKLKSIAAAVASGAAWAAANLPLVLLAVLMTGLILLVDDIITAFQGGDSVLQEFFEERFGVDLVDTLTRMAGAIKFAFEEVINYLTDKLNKLIAFGEKVGQFIFETIHGDTQFQLDEENTGSAMGALRVRQLRSMLPKDATRDQVESAGRALNPFGGLSKQEIDAFFTRVEQAPSGIGNAPINTPSVTKITAPISVTVNGATGTPEQNAAAVRKEVDKAISNMLVTAGAGVGGVR